jgi:hypothetical protein
MKMHQAGLKRKRIQEEGGNFSSFASNELFRSRDGKLGEVLK